MTASVKWADLRTRLISGLVMALGGLAAVWIGGGTFSGLVVLACGLMIWELAGMSAKTALPDSTAMPALAQGLIAAVMLATAIVVDHWVVLPLLAIPSLLIGLSLRHSSKRPYLDVAVIYAAVIMVAGYGLVEFRLTYGAFWLLWLVLVVIVSDIAGYFAGRSLGGPKFWPSISPKKTWSGTVAGWFGAALVGLIFTLTTAAGPDLPWISALVALASQFGDIAESAIKRRAGVKDSSSLIPGHGGLLDRFDGLLGATLMMLVVAQFVVVPQVGF